MMIIGKLSYMIINWGAIDHASRAPQLMSCNYYVHYVVRSFSKYVYGITCVHVRTLDTRINDYL